jgi:hypothetical protein
METQVMAKSETDIDGANLLKALVAAVQEGNHFAR